MGVHFLKTGQDSAKLAKQEEAEAQKRREETGKMWRFWLKEGEEAKITFVDGELSPEGFLLPPRFYEHNLFLNGSWNNYYVCPEKTLPHLKEQCPICLSGDRPPLVALFTIIDHRTYQNKDKTKTFSNQRKLLVVKSLTFELLNKIATKRGGLACATFDVSRVGNKAASVGSMFDFQGKQDLKVLREMYKQEVVDPKTNMKTIKSYFESADYESEIVFRDAAELAKLGLGVPHPSSAGMGSSYMPSGTTADYASQL